MRKYIYYDRFLTDNPILSERNIGDIAKEYIYKDYLAGREYVQCYEDYQDECEDFIVYRKSSSIGNGFNNFRLKASDVFYIRPSSSTRGKELIQLLSNSIVNVYSAWNALIDKEAECQRKGRDYEKYKFSLEQNLQKCVDEYKNTEKNLFDYFYCILTIEKFRRDDTFETFCILDELRCCTVGVFNVEFLKSFPDLNIHTILLKLLLFLSDCGSINAPFVIAIACFEDKTIPVEYEGKIIDFHDAKEYIDMATDRGHPISYRYYEGMLKCMKHLWWYRGEYEDDIYIFAAIKRCAAIKWEKRLEYNEAIRCAEIYNKVGRDWIIENIIYKCNKRNKILSILGKILLIIVGGGLAGYLIVKAVIFIVELVKLFAPIIIAFIIASCMCGGGFAWYFWLGGRDDY